MELISHSYRNYRSFLKDELEKRVANNPNYSLRAYARDLGISPQMMSFVLNGKKSFSPALAAKIANRLGLDPLEASHFLDLVALAHCKSAQVRKLIEFRIEERLKTEPSYKNVDIEVFKVIADWQHCAILDLSLTDDFQSDPHWIAARLGISDFEAKQAIERLKLLELLETIQGKLVKSDLNVSATYGVPSSAARKSSKQFLEKAIQALEAQSIDERDITNITMAIDPSRLPEAKKMITDFRRKLCAFLEGGKRTEVYNFCPALFKVTKTVGAKK